MIFFPLFSTLHGGEVSSPSIRNHLCPDPNWKHHVGIPNKTENKTLPRGSVTRHSSITRTLGIIKNEIQGREWPAYIHLVEINYREQIGTSLLNRYAPVIDTKSLSFPNSIDTFQCIIEITLVILSCIHSSRLSADAF